MKTVKRAFAATYAVLLFGLGTAPAIAAKMDAKLVPDGTYSAKVERIRDVAHATILMENGMEVDAIAARDTVTFTHDLANAKVKVSFVEGQVVALSRF